MRPLLRYAVIALAALAAAPAGVATAQVPGDTARYILPPGNYGGLPTSADSLDQLPSTTLSPRCAAT